MKYTITIEHSFRFKQVQHTSIAKYAFFKIFSRANSAKKIRRWRRWRILFASKNGCSLETLTINEAKVHALKGVQTRVLNCKTISYKQDMDVNEDLLQPRVKTTYLQIDGKIFKLRPSKQGVLKTRIKIGRNFNVELRLKGEERGGENRYFQVYVK